MSKDDFTVNVEKRQELGTSASRRMRRERLIPAVVYGAETESLSLTLTEEVALQLTRHTGMVSIKVKGQRKKISAILKEVDRHPITGDLLHLDLYAVKADQVVTSTVTIEARGEPAGVQKGGQLEQSLHELEIRCLPKDMIEILTVDVSGMELDTALHVEDLQLPEGITATVDPGLAVFQVRLPKMEEEEEEEVPTEEEEGVEGGEAEGEEDGKDETGAEEKGESTEKE